jgi:hypothetical protein
MIVERSEPAVQVEVAVAVAVESEAAVAVERSEPSGQWILTGIDTVTDIQIVWSIISCHPI